MNAVKEDIENLVKKELKSANERFPLFASNHEGYSVIKEEVDESNEEINLINESLELAWGYIKTNGGYTTTNAIKLLKTNAINLACEAIQVAAVAQKFIDSAESREDKQGGGL